VQSLDPAGKFASAAGADIWRWRATDAASGAEVPFATCCGATGFDKSRCRCAGRTDCK
jgi:hypothetical protein